MMYIFHGSDVEKTRAKAFEWVAKARAKEPNLAYARLAREELTSAVLEDAARSGGLFVSRLLILIDDPYQAAKAADDDEDDEEDEDGNVTHSQNVLDEYLDILAASENAIVILAPKLAAPKAKKIVAKATKEYRFDSVEVKPPQRGFNSNLVNALAARSRERLWLEINRALAAGDAPEMLHGLLHWKARDLMEKGGARWSLAESCTLSLDLIELLQNSRRGGLQLAIALERWALLI